MSPKQSTFTVGAVIVGATGSVTVKGEVVNVHPLSSVTLKI
ncbi:hypothetical protein [Aquimarina latercula]|nr:hypothetical protein [Aquimarina latercula]